MTGVCRVCGCTELQPCHGPEGCMWVEPDLCDACAIAVQEAAIVVLAWSDDAHQPNGPAFLNEVAAFLADIKGVCAHCGEEVLIADADKHVCRLVVAP